MTQNTGSEQFPFQFFYFKLKAEQGEKNNKKRQQRAPFYFRSRERETSDEFQIGKMQITTVVYHIHPLQLFLRIDAIEMK
jgi:hypothetical protein